MDSIDSDQPTEYILKLHGISAQQDQKMPED